MRRPWLDLIAPRQREHRMSRFMRWWLAAWCQITMLVFLLAILRESSWR